MPARSNFQVSATARPRVELLESRRLLSSGKGHHWREVIEQAITTIVQQIEVPLETPKSETPAEAVTPVAPETPVIPVTPEATEVPTIETPAGPTVETPVVEVVPQTPEVEVVAPTGETVLPPTSEIVEPVVDVLPDTGSVTDPIPEPVGEVVGVIDTPVVPEIPVPQVDVTEVEVTLPGLDEVVGGIDTGIVDEVPTTDESVFGEAPIGDDVEVVDSIDESNDIGGEMTDTEVEPVEVVTIAPVVTLPPPAAEVITTPVVAQVTPPPTRPAFNNTWQQSEQSSKPQTSASQQVATQKPATEVMPAVTTVQNEVRVTVTQSPIANEPAAVETKAAEPKQAQSASAQESSESTSNEQGAQVAVALAPAAGTPVSAPAAQQSDAPAEEGVVDVQTVVNGEVLPVMDDGHPVLGKALRNGYGRVAGNDEQPPKQEAKRAPRIIKQEIVEEEKAEETAVVVEPALMQAELAANTESAQQVAAETASEEVVLAKPIPVQTPVEADDNQLPPPVAAAMVTPVDAASSTVRNVVAALAVGTAVGLVQLHQWRKRKTAEAASKLASLLSFDPLAVWLDDSNDRRS